MQISSGEVIGSKRVKIQRFVQVIFLHRPRNLLPRNRHPATLVGKLSCPITLIPHSFPLPLTAHADWKFVQSIRNYCSNSRNTDSTSEKSGAALSCNFTGKPLMWSTGALGDTLGLKLNLEQSVTILLVSLVLDVAVRSNKLSQTSRHWGTRLSLFRPC